MSLDATRWAWMQQGLRPLEKLVLLALADRADAANRAFPSYEVLKQDTGADRKTIWRALKALESLGLIEDSGERRGRTGKVVVWQLVGVETREKQFHKRNHSKNGTVPFFPANSSKNGTTKQFQKRNIEPTNIEPIKEPPPLPPKVVNTTRAGNGEAEVDRGGGGNLSLRGEKMPAQVSETPEQADGEPLIYPSRLSPEEVEVASHLLRQAPLGLRQDILDELAGLIEMGLIRKSDLGVLRGLVQKARRGEFIPELALKVQRGRRAREKIKQRREHSQSQVPVAAAPGSGIEALAMMQRILGKRRKNHDGNG